MQKTIDEIIAERKRQDEKWGEQNHSQHEWMVILLEEIGEAGKALLEGDEKGYKKEMIQAAAVIIAMLECLKRQKYIKSLVHFQKNLKRMQDAKNKD